MDTLIRLDATEPGHADEAVARRLREEFSRQGIRTISEAARIAGIRQQALNARMIGDIGFRVAEIDQICQRTGADYEYVVSGIRAIDPAVANRPKPPPSGKKKRPGRSPRFQPLGWNAVA
jgi:hypothetical protein